MSNGCPVCGSQADQGTSGDSRQYDCPRCGPFVITGTACAMLGSRLAADAKAFARISHAIRSQTSYEAWFRVDSTNLDKLANAKLPGVEVQQQNLLRWLSTEAGDDRLEAVELPVEGMAAIVGAVNDDRVDDLVRHMEQQGLLEDVPEDCLRLTPLGWSALGRGQVVTQASQTPEPGLTARDMVVRSHCPECGPDRRADVVASHTEFWSDSVLPIHSETKFDILRCCGCSEVYVRKEHYFSEWDSPEQDPHTGRWFMSAHPETSLWPTPERRKRPIWSAQITDPVAHRLLDEVYRSLSDDTLTLAAMGVRALLDRTLELAGADPAAGFQEKLRHLSQEDLGVIGKHEREILTVMTDAGSAAAHRGWKPDFDQLCTILDATESMLQRTAILPNKAAKLGGAVPPKPTRKKG